MIIASRMPIPLGREICDFDREDAHGQIVTYRDQPVEFLRVATLEEYLEDQAARGRPRDEHPHGPYYYKVSLD